MSRAAAVLAAMQRELQERKVGLDASAEVAEVTVTVKLTPGTSWVRSVEYTERRIMRAREQRT